MIEEIFTKNLTIESMHELEMNWATTITLENISAAYQRYVDLYNQMLENGIKPTFEIDSKERAKDCLIKLIQRKED